MKGTIHADAAIHSLVSYFNPRTREGYDFPSTKIVLSCLLALIPIPTKGTILLQQQIDKNDNSFNPRTHEGYDGLSTLQA